MTADAPQRPDPELLLADLDSERGGGLRIFLGAAPGVGKTYGMLLAARELRTQGRDVVVGIIESHGRAETEALLEGFEVVPLRALTYRERPFEEFDLDAVLARSPEFVLVDELAHRNIPGTRHERRYQDIQELLEHGIGVWTTLNVQHLESLNDTVARITGVHMRETVPDSLLEKARDIVVIDLTPGELIERLSAGKVYVPEQARAALDGFFSASNLTALRELAFQAAAQRVDADLQRTMRRHGKQGPWPARERIVVITDGFGNAEQAVRAGRRLAQRRKVPWSVVTVDRGGARTVAAETRLARVLALAERLGAETVRLRGSGVADEVLRYARERNASSIVLGRTRRRRLAGLFGMTLSQQLLRRNTEFDIVFIGADPGARPTRRRRDRLRAAFEAAGFRDYAFAVATVTAAGAVSAVLEHVLPLTLPNLSLVFLIGVLLVAARTALAPAIVSAGLSFLTFNFFFTDPRFSFSMARTDEIATVFFFLVVALIGSHLASRLRRQLAALRATNEQSQILIDLGKRLARAADTDTIEQITVRAIAEFMHVPACIRVCDPDTGQLQGFSAYPGDIQLDEKDRAAARWTHERGQVSGCGTGTLASSAWRFIPLVLDEARHGILGLRLGDLPVAPGAEQLLLTDALANQVTLTLARSRLVASLEHARVAEETERLRAALLSSVSHDLRTPLASMIGAAESLRDLRERLSDDDRRELLDTLLEEGHRLDRYIGNLLDMTRLGDGTLQVQRDWVALEDIVGAALRRTRELTANVTVQRALPDDLPLLYVHPALIEQVLVNVLENAARYSPPEGEIAIAACADADWLTVSVTDQGPGIPAEKRAQVFDMFFTGGDRGRQGTGLGLAICHGMVSAHGGTIEARAGPDGRGTRIVIRLPLTRTPPDQAVEE